MRKLTIVASLMVLAASFAPSILAQGKGKGKGNAAPTTYSIGLETVSDVNNDGLSVGDSVRFTVPTIATTPWVSLVCYQGTSMVYALGGYPADKVFLLSSGAWTSGAAECTATVSTTVDGSKTTTVGTLSFPVGA
jgi:hypothetical protein